MLPRYHLDRSGTGPAGRCIRTEILRVASATQMLLHYGLVWKFSYSPRERNDDIINRIATKSRSKNWFHFHEIFSIQDYSFRSSAILVVGLSLSSASIMVRIMRRNNSYCIYDCVCWLDTSCCDIGVGGFVIITIRSTMHRVKCQAATFIAMYTEWKGRCTGSIHEM